jgi:hypothetical protein
LSLSVVVLGCFQGGTGDALSGCLSIRPSSANRPALLLPDHLVVNIRIEDEFELEFEDDGSTNVQEAKRPASLTREQSGTLRLSGTDTSSKADPDPAGHGIGIVVPTAQLSVVIDVDGQRRRPLSGDSGTHDGAVVTFSRSRKGRRRSGDAGKARRDGKGRVQVLVFPSGFEGGLEQDLPIGH